MSRPWQILAGMEPPPLQSEQQAAKRKALLGEQQAELSLDVIRQQLETAKATAAEASKKARIADQVRAARAKGGDPASTYRELLASDPEAADAYREAYNKEQLTLNPENQPTPEFAVGAAPMAPGAPTGAIPQNLEGGDLAPNTVSVEAQNRIVALPATPANVIDMSGNARDIFRRSARQVAEQGIAKTQAEEAIKSQNRITEAAANKPPIETVRGNPGDLIIRYDRSGKEISREQVPFRPEASDKSITPFEVWQNENPGRPVSEWLALEAKNRPQSTIAIQTVDEQGNAVTRIVPKAPGSEYEAAPTTDARNRATALKKADPILRRVSDLSEKINTGQGLIAKASGTAAKIAAKANYDDDVAEYESLISGFTPLVARAVGHTGVLTEQDVQSVRALFPKPGDSKSLRDRKVNQILTLMKEITEVGQQQPSSGTGEWKIIEVK